MGEELLVALHELTPCFLVQRTFGEWHNQQAFDNLENMGKRPRGGIPILLERVHANLTRRNSHVGVEYLSEKVACELG